MLPPTKLHEIKGHGTILRDDCAHFGTKKALRYLDIIGERMEMGRDGQDSRDANVLVG
jgi:hypothetical protein